MLHVLRLKMSKDPGVRRAAASALGEGRGALSVNALVGALADNDREVRQAAAEALGKRADSRALEPLMAMYRAGDLRDRPYALAALAKIADGGAFEFLVGLLHPNERYSVGAAQLVSVAAGLSRIGDERAIPPLVSILDYPSTAVRRAATGSLASLGWTPTSPRLDAIAAVACGEWNRVVQMGEAAVGPLLQALEDVDNADSRDAARTLGRLGVPAIQPLIARITAGPASVNVIDALGFAGPAAILPLFLALKHEEARQTGQAAKAIATLLEGLRKIGAPTVSWMVDVLEKGDQVDRRTAAQVLGSAGDASAAPALRTTLLDPSSSVRWSAANALKGLGCEPTETDELRPVFVVAAQQWDEAARMGERCVCPLLAVLPDASVSWNAARAIGKIGDPRGVQPLVRLLTNEDGTTRRVAVEALAQFRDAGVEALLCAAVRDSDLGVRLEAATTLGKIGTGAAIQGLVDGLSDGHDAVRRRAADALATRGWVPSNATESAAFAVAQHRWADAVGAGVAASEALVRAHQDPEFDIRLLAAEALVEIGHTNDVIATLLGALAHPGPKVRGRAAEALGKTRDPSVCEPLGKLLLDKDGHVQHAASVGLTHLGVAGVNVLAAALLSPDHHARQLAVQALGEIGTPEVVEPLIGALVNRNYTGALAAQALGNIGDTRAVDPLINALSNSSDVVCFAAKALGQFGDPRAVRPLLAALPAYVGTDVSKRDRTRAVVTALNAIGPAAAEELIDALADPKAPRWAVATALGRCGDLRAVQPLITALAEPKPGQGAVAEALGILGDARAVPALIAAVDEHSLPEAVVALGRLPDPRAIDSLLAYAKRRSGGTIDEYNLEHSKVDPAVSALDHILRRSAAFASVESLKAAAAFSDLAESIWFMVDGCTRGTRPSSISCAPIRQLARQELIRRGEQAAESDGSA